MPEKEGYAPDSRAGVSSDKRAFPENVEPRGQRRFGPAPYPERPPVRNVHNVDPHGKRTPRGPRS